MSRHLCQLMLVLLLAVNLVPAGYTCCSLAPAEFSHTYGWVGEIERKGEVVHTLFYENQASNGVDRGNAMILPIPAVAGSLSEENMLEGKPFKGLGDDLYNSNCPPAKQAKPIHLRCQRARG